MAKTRGVFSFKHGVFDLDGTLIDSMGECGTIFADLLAPSGVPFDEARRYYYRTTGSPMRDQFREIMDRHGAVHDAADLERLHAAFNARFLACDFAFFPKAKKLVRTLAAGGARLFLSSASSDACVAKRLAGGGLDRCFVRALGSTAVSKGPAHLSLFARTAGIRPAAFARDAFFCGDGETDMQIAKEAGIHAIGVLGTVSESRLRRAGADRIIRTIGDLLADRAN